MTDNYYKALGLPTANELLLKAKERSEGSILVELDYHGDTYEWGAEDMRSEAASRIKEVAESFDQWKFRNGWIQILDSIYRKETWLNASGTHKRQDDVSFDELFDLFIKERSGE